jgi:hypothetical protein
MAELGAPYVFLYHASADRERALAPADALERSGVRAWIDRASIAGGASWGREIVEGIKGCAALLILCTDAAMRSRNVRREIQLAWCYERGYLPPLSAGRHRDRQPLRAVARRRRPRGLWAPPAAPKPSPRASGCMTPGGSSALCTVALPTHMPTGRHHRPVVRARVGLRARGGARGRARR